MAINFHTSHHVRLTAAAASSTVIALPSSSSNVVWVHWELQWRSQERERAPSCSTMQAATDMNCRSFWFCNITVHCIIIVHCHALCSGDRASCSCIVIVHSSRIRSSTNDWWWQWYCVAYGVWWTPLRVVCSSHRTNILWLSPISGFLSTTGEACPALWNGLHGKEIMILSS